MKKLNILIIALILISTIGMGVSASLGVNKEVEIDEELLTFATANNLNEFTYKLYPFSDEEDRPCVYTKDNRAIGCMLVEKDNNVAISNAYDTLTTRYLINRKGLDDASKRSKFPDVEGNITLKTKVAIKI